MKRSHHRGSEIIVSNTSDSSNNGSQVTEQAFVKLVIGFFNFFAISRVTMEYNTRTTRKAKSIHTIRNSQIIYKRIIIHQENNLIIESIHNKNSLSAKRVGISTFTIWLNKALSI